MSFRHGFTGTFGVVVALFVIGFILPVVGLFFLCGGLAFLGSIAPQPPPRKVTRPAAVAPADPEEDARRAKEIKAIQDALPRLPE